MPINTSAIEAAIPVAAGVVSLVLGFRRAGGNPVSSDKTKRLLRWLGPALIAFGVLLFVTGGKSESANAREIVAGMKAKMKLPVRVDDVTRLDDVRATSGTEIGYFLTLTSVTQAQLGEDSLAQRLESSLRGGACENPDYLKLLKAGLSVRVTYTTADAREVVQVAIAPGDCGL